MKRYLDLKLLLFFSFFANILSIAYLYKWEYLREPVGATDENPNDDNANVSIAITRQVLQSNVSALDRKFFCTLQSKPSFQHTFARIFIYQKNGGTQLLTALSHYMHALPPDSIVVIDNDSFEPSSNFLKKFVGQGVHLWKCSGDKLAKGSIWSAVIDVYKNHSDYVFPVDVDELITVRGFDEKLYWNTSMLNNALVELNKNHSGKPYKLLFTDSIPTDCFDSSENLHLSDLCKLKYAPRQTYPTCMNKCFSRGQDFYSTDLGNHHMVTSGTIALAPHLNHTGFFIYNLCTGEGVDNWYGISRLVVIHVQKFVFKDWVIHTLRGASASGFTTKDIDCSQVKLSFHYCYEWNKMVQLGFSVDRLLEVYWNRFCQFDPIQMYNVSSVFDHICLKV
jgi:hypothetical protein